MTITANLDLDPRRPARWRTCLGDAAGPHRGRSSDSCSETLCGSQPTEEITGTASTPALPQSHSVTQLHRRDDDIIGGTFGRGIWILDDYAPLRSITQGALASDGGVMPLRDAWSFVPRLTNQATGRPTLGSTAWAGENPPFGATFTVHVPELRETSQEDREQAEQGLRDSGSDVPFPGYDLLRSERNESGPMVRIRISDDSGTTVRWVPVPASEGIHRATWDLRHPAPNPVSFSNPEFRPPWVTEPTGPLAAPGEYSAQLVVIDQGSVTEIGSTQSFAMRSVPTLPEGTDSDAVEAFHLRVAELQRQISIAASELSQASERVRYMRAALERTPTADPALYGDSTTWCNASTISGSNSTVIRFVVHRVSRSPSISSWQDKPQHLGGLVDATGTMKKTSRIQQAISKVLIEDLAVPRCRDARCGRSLGGSGRAMDARSAGMT